MECTNSAVEAGTILEQPDDALDAAIEASGTPWEIFHREIDAWARHALAMNGFGDG